MTVLFLIVILDLLFLSRPTKLRAMYIYVKGVFDLKNLNAVSHRKVTYVFLNFLIFFFAFPFSPFLFFVLYWFAFFWTSFQVFQESIIETGNSHHEVARYAGNFASSFRLLHISGPNKPITPICISLERSFSPEVEYRWYQFWSNIMTSEVEQGPTLVKAASFGRHRRQ